jgi:nucleoside-diphosphate-sugar epimerase
MSPQWHERSELAIRRSGVNYTVLRPTEIVDQPPAKENNRDLILIQGDSGERAPLPGSISINDIVDIIMLAIANKETLSQTSVIISSVPRSIGNKPADITWKYLIPKVNDDRVISHEVLSISNYVYTTITLGEERHVCSSEIAESLCTRRSLR